MFCWPRSCSLFGSWIVFKYHLYESTRLLVSCGKAHRFPSKYGRDFICICFVLLVVFYLNSLVVCKIDPGWSPAGVRNGVARLEQKPDRIPAGVRNGVARWERKPDRILPLSPFIVWLQISTKSSLLQVFWITWLLCCHVLPWDSVAWHKHEKAVLLQPCILRVISCPVVWNWFKKSWLRRQIFMMNVMLGVVSPHEDKACSILET